MDSLPLYKTTNGNLLQILRKCDDVSFVRAVQTCHRLSEIADQAKPRIFTTAYLAVFVYYDKKQKKMMFDVPYVEKRRKPVLRHRKRPWNWTKIDRESEDSAYWYDIRNDWIYRLEDPPVSQLLFRRSDRPCAFHKKMTADSLGEILSFFRFETLAIDLNDYDDTDSMSNLMEEEILKVVPFIQANSLSLITAYNDEIYYRIIRRVWENCHIQQLRTLPDKWYGRYGYLEKLPMDWHKLVELEVSCLETNMISTYNDLITKWEAGQTSIKYLKLNVAGAPRNYQPTFQDGPVFLKLDQYGDYQDSEFHYLYHVNGNRWAITLFGRRIFFFYDISDCDSCDCQTEFCFKKLMEVIGLRTTADKKAIDWGPIMDKWNAKKVKTMEGLGKLIKQLVKQPRPRDPANPCRKQPGFFGRRAP